MQSEKLTLEEADCFSSLFVDYINQKPELTNFYSHFPSKENFAKAIESKHFDQADRKVLVERINAQYEGLEYSDTVRSNIDRLLKEKTFTITTGHQLNLLTGPLYFIYKIVTVINTCKELKSTYPEYDFVPVYWMATEDHDFEEINHFHFDGKKYQWESDQKGPVGRFSLAGVAEILDQLPEGIDFFKEAYKKDNLAEAVRCYVNHLFENEGLVIVDADDPVLKRKQIPVVENDLFEHDVQKASEKNTLAIQDLGYKTQVNAREINFFYIEDGLRERIEKKGERYHVLETDVSFSQEEMKAHVNEHPEKFSPNVVLRPLYQELILPNLAYIGGPAEAVYWLQLRSVFEHFQVPFPIIMPRNFALIVTEGQASKWKKTGLNWVDLFSESHQSVTKWVKTHTNGLLSYEKELEEIWSSYDHLIERTEKTDVTLVQHLQALKATSTRKLQAAEKKLIRAEKRKQEAKVRQIESVKEALFPGGSLQERRDSFLNFYLQDKNFIQQLLDHFDPFDYRMQLLIQGSVD